VESVVFLLLLFTVLDRRVLLSDQVDVEAEERSDEQSHHARKDVGCHYVVSYLVVKALRVEHSSHQHWVSSEGDKKACARTVEQHVEEEFVVVEADAVGNPRAVVVHFENAAVALGTVMASVGLRLKAPLTDSNSTEFLLLHRYRFLESGA